jgi:hypothetical protein
MADFEKIAVVKKLDAKSKPDSKEYKDTVASLDKGYSSAVKALGVLGVKMATKKLDPAKIVPLMQKTGKEAEIGLKSDAKKGRLSLEVTVGPNSNMLGLVDLNAEKDIEKRRVIIKSLIECGLEDKKALEEFNKQYPPDSAKDAKVAENRKRIEAEVKKNIDDFTRIKAGYEKLDYDQIAKNGKIYPDFYAFSKKERNEENLDFLKDVESKKDAEYLVKTYVDPDAPRQVNLKANVVKAIMAAVTAKKEPDFTPAVNEIKGLIHKDVIGRYTKAKGEEYGKKIADEKARLAKLGK